MDHFLGNFPIKFLEISVSQLVQEGSYSEAEGCFYLYYNTHWQIPFEENEKGYG